MNDLDYPQLPLVSTLDQGVPTDYARSTDDSSTSEASPQDVNMALGSPVLLPHKLSSFPRTAEVAYPKMDTDNNKSGDVQRQLDYVTGAEEIERYIALPDEPAQTSLSRSPKADSGKDNPSSNNGRAEVKLRCASRKPKNRTRKKPAALEKVLRARNCHNKAERQYRTRLKLQFENLLAVLQASPAGLDQPGPGISDHGFSRREVLDAARRRILTLEKENEQLGNANDRLLKDMATIQQILRTTWQGCEPFNSKQLNSIC